MDYVAPFIAEIVEARIEEYETRLAQLRAHPVAAAKLIAQLEDRIAEIKGEKRTIGILAATIALRTAA